MKDKLYKKPKDTLLSLSLERIIFKWGISGVIFRQINGNEIEVCFKDIDIKRAKDAQDNFLITTDTNANKLVNLIKAFNEEKYLAWEYSKTFDSLIVSGWLEPATSKWQNKLESIKENISSLANGR